MALAYTILVAGLGNRAEEFLVPILAGQGHLVYTAVGVGAVREILSSSLDLVLLDLPSQQELEYVREVRQQVPAALMVIGPARSDKLLVAALERGADDYIQRPFRTDELLARIRAQLRRLRRSYPAPAQIGELRVDLAGRLVTLAGSALDLRPEEFNLLSLLVTGPSAPQPSDSLIAQIWGRGRRSELALLEATVARLRGLIEADPTAPAILRGDPQAGYWLGQDA